MNINIKSCNCGIYFDTDKVEKELMKKNLFEGGNSYYLRGFVCPVCKTLWVKVSDFDFHPFDYEDQQSLKIKLNAKDILEY